MVCHQKRKLYAERLRELNRLGLPMLFDFGSVDNQTSDIVIERAAPDIECPIIDLQDGRTLYMVWLSLVAERPGASLYDYRFVRPWPDRGFQSLPTFADSHIGEAYVLPGEWEYPREDVLNLRFGKTGWHLPCKRVEGLLVALSDTPIPEEYSHGSPTPVRVEFFSKSGRQLAETTVTLWADRMTHHPQTAQHSAEGRTAKPVVAPAAAAKPSAIALPPRSTLFDQRERNALRAADRRPEKGAPPAARVREDSPRTAVRGEQRRRPAFQMARKPRGGN